MWPLPTSQASSVLFPHILLYINSVLSLAQLAHASFLCLEGVPHQTSKHLFTLILLNWNIIFLLNLGVFLLLFCTSLACYLYISILLLFFLSYRTAILQRGKFCVFVVIVELTITSTYYTTQHKSEFQKHLPSGTSHTTGTILSYFHASAFKIEHHELPL